MSAEPADIEDLASQAQAHEVISCSRRTDVPANYMPWLLGALSDQVVEVRVRAHVTRVSLSPDTVKAWVWWSKNYGPWLEAYRAHPELFARYKAHIFHFTITGLDELESVQASLEERLAQMRELARIGYVVARFDPITRYEGEGGALRSNEHLIESLVPRFKECGASEVAFKFCVPYRAVLSRMKRAGKPLVAFAADEKRAITRRLMGASASAGIALKACCPDPDEIVEGLQVSPCIDGEVIDRLLAASGEGVKKRKDPGQRKRCRCVVSRDIGDGNRQMACPHKCLYCYAKPGDANEKFA